MSTDSALKQLSRACVHPYFLRRKKPLPQQTGWDCSAGALRLSAPRRASPKFQQKMLGSYPVAPEFEMVWRDRTIAYGGYIQQSISPYQMKFMYPYYHTFPARFWTKFSAYWWSWIWPMLISLLIYKQMMRDVEEEIKEKYWY